ncbi:MAG: hypothetical protein ACI9U1_001480, partial [Porticoccaceae bacterium]
APFFWHRQGRGDIVGDSFTLLSFKSITYKS